MTIINSNLLEIKKVTELPNLDLILTNYFAHCKPDGILGKSTLDELCNFLAPYISSIGASGFIAITTDTLPNPTSILSAYSIVPEGTYHQTTGGDLNASGDLNIISWDGTTWSVANAVTLDLSKYLNDRWQFNPTAYLDIEIVETTSNSIGYIKSNSDLYVFNPIGGYYVISPFYFPFKEGSVNKDIFYLSASATEYVPLNSTSGNSLGTAYVLYGDRIITRDTEKIIIGSAFAGSWSSIYNTFSKQQRLLGDGISFSSTNTRNIRTRSVWGGGTEMQVFSGVVVFNKFNANNYSLLAPHVYTFAPQNFIYLSKSATSYVPVDLLTNGESVYLYPFHYQNPDLPSYKNCIGITNGGAMGFFTKHNAFIGENNINSDRYKVSETYRRMVDQVVYGDSNTAGFALFPGEDWGSQLCSDTYLNFINRAVSSSGSQNQMNSFIENSLTYNITQLNIAMIGFNDIRLEPTADVPVRDRIKDVKAANTVISVLRSMIAWNFLREATDCSNFDTNDKFTRVFDDGWREAPGSGTTLRFCKKFGGHVNYCDRINDTFECTINDLVEDVILGTYITNDTGLAGVFEIYIDDILFTTFDSYQSYFKGDINVTWNESLTPYAIRIPVSNLSKGRVIKTKLISGNMRLDYIGILKTRSQYQAPFILNTIPKLPSVTYPIDYTTAGAHEYLNGRIYQLSQEFKDKFKVTVSEVNNYYKPDLNPDEQSYDGIHLSKLGQSRIKDAVLDSLSEVFTIR